MKCLIILLTVLIFLLTYNLRQSFEKISSETGSTPSSVSLPVSSIFRKIFLKDATSLHIDEVAEDEGPMFGDCRVELWNNVTTDSIPMRDYHQQWMALDVGKMPNLGEAQLRVVSAFVYKDEVVVTTTAQNRYGNTVHCRYFDCNRVEIPNSSFETQMFPMTAAYCARRAGAKFIGLTETLKQEAVDLVPVTFRAFDEPIHEISVCVGPIYGSESRWLEIVETTEHHVLIGIRHFYFTVFNEMDSYTRKLLDEYQRIGTADVTIIQSEYQVMDWMFHMMQITDCFFRARHHSKWILNVDIDERLVVIQMPLRSFLRTVDPNVGEISFAANKVQRTDPLPEKFSGVEDLLKQLLFLNCNTTSQQIFSGMKGLVRPDKTEAMFYHWTWVQHPGIRLMTASKKIGYIRHYRTTLPGLVQDWTRHGLHFRTTRLGPKFEEKLVDAIIRRVRRVYDQRPIWCEEVPQYLLKFFTKDNYHCQWKNGTLFSDN